MTESGMHSGTSIDFHKYLEKVKATFQDGPHRAAMIWRYAKAVLDHNGNTTFHWYGPKL